VRRFDYKVSALRVKHTPVVWGVRSHLFDRHIQLLERLEHILDILFSHPQRGCEKASAHDHLVDVIMHSSSATLAPPNLLEPPISDEWHSS
jgi:hypothetical protein